VRESAFKHRREACPSGKEFIDLMKRAFHAADELGLDWAALMREQLQEEGVLPKPKEPEDDKH
jgi:hypothetical protein